MDRISNGPALARRVSFAGTREDASIATTPATPDAVFALVYRQMRALAGHRDVDELVQIAAEQALRALPSFAGRSQLSTWTFRICYLTIRKQDRWYSRWLRRFTLTSDGELPEVGIDAAPTDERLAREQRAVRLRFALERLSPARRTAVVLHDLEGLSVDEIAEIVDALPRAVRSRLRDGRKALAKLLEADPTFGADADRGQQKEQR